MPQPGGGGGKEDGGGGGGGAELVSVRVSIKRTGSNAVKPEPVNQPVTFRITSSDVVHGFQVVGTNANAMAIPGYVSQFTLTLPRPGEYLITCNEYCGVFHHAMVGKLVVQ